MQLPRNAQIWFPGLLKAAHRRRRQDRLSRPKSACLAVTDHYEPLYGRVDETVARERVALWRSRWPEIAAQEPFMKLLKEAVLDSPDKVRGAYYFPQWPAVHKAFNDTVTKAVTGKREDIAKVLAEGAPLVSKAAQ